MSLDINTNKTSCEHTQKRVQLAESIAQEASNKIIQLKVEVLKNSNELNSLRNEVEDLRNRQMRKSLVFYGFPENGNESWDESKHLLEKHIEACGLEQVDIDRAHRARPRKSSERGYTRPIFVEFVTWQDANYILQKTNKLSKPPKSGTSPRILVQQLYGKKTAQERNRMLKIRKFFMRKNPSWKVNLSYPAILHIDKGTGSKKI